MFPSWVSEIAQTLGYALFSSLIFVIFRVMMLARHSKATGFFFIREQGCSIAIIGFFTLMLGLLLSRLDLGMGEQQTATPHFLAVTQSAPVRK